MQNLLAKNLIQRHFKLDLSSSNGATTLSCIGSNIFVHFFFQNYFVVSFLICENTTQYNANKHCRPFGVKPEDTVSTALAVFDVGFIDNQPEVLRKIAQSFEKWNVEFQYKSRYTDPKTINNTKEGNCRSFVDYMLDELKLNWKQSKQTQMFLDDAASLFVIDKRWNSQTFTHKSLDEHLQNIINQYQANPKCQACDEGTWEIYRAFDTAFHLNQDTNEGKCPRPERWNSNENIPTWRSLDSETGIPRGEFQNILHIEEEEEEQQQQEEQQSNEEDVKKKFIQSKQK